MLPKTYKCKCGCDVDFPALLYPRWDYVTDVKCECGIVAVLFRGRVIRFKEPAASAGAGRGGEGG